MEINPTIEQEAESRLPPPAQSKFSIVLNGAGNGAMVAALPFGVYEIYKRVTEKVTATPKQNLITFAAVAGAGIGAWYGTHEARQLEGYRTKTGREITRLNRRIDALEARTIGTHAELVTNQRLQADEEEHSR